MRHRRNGRIRRYLDMLRNRGAPIVSPTELLITSIGRTALRSPTTIGSGRQFRPIRMEGLQQPLARLWGFKTLQLLVEPATERLEMPFLRLWDYGVSLHQLAESILVVANDSCLPSRRGNVRRREVQR